MSYGLDPLHDRWLASHRWALLATRRRNGAPQVTMVAYHWDGRDAVVSCTRARAKWHNARRDPNVSLVVPEDRQYLTITGVADCVETDPERTDLTLRLQASLLPNDAASLQRDIEAGLDAAGRVVIRVLPTSAVGSLG